jgi:hypothetical protein
MAPEPESEDGAPAVKATETQGTVIVRVLFSSLNGPPGNGVVSYAGYAVRGGPENRPRGISELPCRVSTP